jgi:protein O-mannosyl-transferase
MKLSNIYANNLRAFVSVAFICIAIITVSVVAFGSIMHTFFIADDATLLTNLRHFEYFLKHLTGDWGAGFYRPLIDLFFYVDYQIWGKSPFGYHLTNVFMHALNGILVFSLAIRLTGDKRIGALAGLIFAVHPSHSEAVSWISGRIDVVCSFFYLGAILAFAAYRSSHKQYWKYALSLVCFIFALMTKELAVTLPAAIVLYDICMPASPIRHTWASWKKRILVYSPFFILFAGYWVFRFQILGRIGGYGTHLSLKEFNFNTIFLYLNDFLHLVRIPFPEYIRQGPYLAAEILLVAILVILLFIYSPRPVKFALGFSVITLLPAWNMYGGRFQCFPSTGIVIAMGILVINGLDRLLARHFFKGALQAIIGACIILLMGQGLQEANKTFLLAASFTNPQKLLTLRPNIPERSELVFRGVSKIPNLRFRKTLIWYLEEYAVQVREVDHFSQAISPEEPEELEQQYFFQYHQNELYDRTQFVRRQYSPKNKIFFMDIPKAPDNIIRHENSELIFDVADVVSGSDDVPHFHLEIVTALGNGLQVDQDAPVAKISVLYADGSTSTYDLLVGEHTADWAMEKPGIAEHIRYARPAVWEARTITEEDGNIFKANKYLATFPLNTTEVPSQIHIKFVHPDENLSLEIFRLMLRHKL